VTAQTGRDECIQESPAPPDLYTVRVPFTNWLRQQLHSGDLYALSASTVPPDDLCLYSLLLPALPALPGERPTRTIAFGSIPPAMASRIAAHDPAVRVYAPGFALQSNYHR
jgi:hypothetical protein